MIMLTRSAESTFNPSCFVWEWNYVWNQVGIYDNSKSCYINNHFFTIFSMKNVNLTASVNYDI